MKKKRSAAFALLLVFVMLAAGTLPCLAAEGTGPFQERIYLRSASYDEFEVGTPEFLCSIGPGESWPLEEYLPGDRYVYGIHDGYDEENAYFTEGFSETVHDEFYLGEMPQGFRGFTYGGWDAGFSIPYCIEDPSEELQELAQGESGDRVARFSDFYEVYPVIDREAYLGLLRKYDKKYNIYGSVSSENAASFGTLLDEWDFIPHEGLAAPDRQCLVHRVTGEAQDDPGHPPYSWNADYRFQLDRPIPIRYDVSGTEESLPFVSLSVNISLDNDEKSFDTDGVYAEMDRIAAEFAAIPFHYNVYVRRVEPPREGAPVPPPATVDKKAEDTPGEDSGVNIPAVIVTGVLGAAGAAAAAGAASGKKRKDEEERARYRLYISKDFGNRIRKGAEPVELRARIEKILPSGERLRRNDLSSDITFEGGRYLQVSGTYAAGGSAAVRLFADKACPESVRDDAVSILYSGEGGTFTERLHFTLVGEPWLEFFGSRNDNTIEILAGSGGSWQFTCRPQDFTSPPVLTAENTSSDFKVKTEPEENGDWLITVTDTGRKEEQPEKLQVAETVPVHAKYEGGVYDSYFTVIKCQEGIALNLNGSRPEIPGETLEGEKEPPKIKISFAVGIWNEEEARLDVRAPQELKVSTEYDKLVQDKIRIECLPDGSNMRDHEITCDLGADKPFAALENIPVKVIAEAGDSGRVFRAEFPFLFLGDVEKAKAEYRQEYKMCVKITRDYIPDHLYNKMIRELHETRNIMGLYELREYRHKIWKMAQHLNTLEREEYIKEAAKCDDEIAKLQLVTAATDWAYDALIGLLIKDAVLTTWAVQQLKPAALSFWDAYKSAPEGSSWMDILTDWCKKALTSSLGTLDGLVEFPKMPKPGASGKEYALYGAHVMAFLTVFGVYRIVYRLFTDKDDDGNPVGFFETLKTVVLSDILVGKLFINFATGFIDVRKRTDRQKGAFYPTGKEAFVSEPTKHITETLTGTGKTIAETAKSGGEVVAKGAAKAKDALNKAADAAEKFAVEKSGAAAEELGQEVGNLINYVKKTFGL